MKRFWTFPLLWMALAAPAHAGETSPIAGSIPPEESRRLDERINDLFPSEPREPLPEPSVWDDILSPFATVVYLPGKAVVACLYTLGAGVHLLALARPDAQRIILEGVTGDWVLTPKSIAGADPIDIVGPDRRFPGHNPVARATFVKAYYLLYSSQSYRGVPEGVPASAGVAPGFPEGPPAGKAMETPAAGPGE